MPKQIKKRPPQKTADTEAEVKDKLTTFVENIKDRQKRLATYGIVVLVIIIAIIGIPNPDRPGAEIVKAVIQLKEGVEESDAVKESIQKYANENLSKYEVPKIWEFKEELPLTLVGKVLKKALREE